MAWPWIPAAPASESLTTSAKGRKNEAHLQASDDYKRWNAILWIDAPCILQASKDGWARENPREYARENSRENSVMGCVYKFKQCNFMASADADGGDGFFVNKPVFQLSTWSRPDQLASNPQ